MQNNRINKFFNIFFITLSGCPYKARSSDILITSDDSNVLKEIGLSGTILHTPGHTEDSISVYIEGLGIFSGDTMVNMYGITGNKNLPILFDDLDQIYKSWEKIIAIGAKTVFPAHGKPCSMSVLKNNIDKHRGKKHEPVLPVKK
jgi:glyoxylase-like metal-dependent hydrolase (beta-lactamase superfamily II)